MAIALKVMSNYRRSAITGGTYFITQVTYQRIPWLCGDLGRKALREAIAITKWTIAIQSYLLFKIDCKSDIESQGLLL